jgi:protein-disulfide isomerase
MTMRLGLALVAAMALLAGCGGGDEGNKVSPPPGGQKIAAVAPPAGTEWTQVVSETPDGGFRMGNPNAPVKLVEYGSFGCSHCAAFEAEGAEPLQNQYIKSGRVSWEFRSYLIFPGDPAISMLTRCHGPQAFFLLKEQLYATQADWAAKMMQSAEQLEALPPAERLKPVIQAAGLDAFFRQRGMPQAKIDSCLSDKAALDRVLAVSARGQDEFEVTGTPTFFINGSRLENAGAWSVLEPQLKRALGE